MTLVVGATGLLGTEICRRLASAGKPFKAMVRATSDPAKKNVLNQLGGELIEADLKNRSSLDRACQGATAVITTPTAILSQQQGDTFDTVDLHGQYISSMLRARRKSATTFSFPSRALC